MADRERHPFASGHESFCHIARAVEAVEHPVWVTLVFIEPEFRFPDGSGCRIGAGSPPRSLLDRMSTTRTQGKRSLNFPCSKFPGNSLTSSSTITTVIAVGRGEMIHGTGR